MRILALFLCLASPGLAQTCPAVPDRTADLAALFTAANAARSFREGEAISAEMWKVFTDAPDARAQALLDEGMRARGSFDLDRALSAFDRLVDYCPDYAEGYNQRKRPASLHCLA